MAGVAGEVIGLGTGAQTNIAPAVTLTDGTTSARGCTTNFIGFGLGATSTEQPPADFNTTDDTVTLAITGGSSYEPTYTGNVLSWTDTTP